MHLPFALLLIAPFLGSLLPQEGATNLQETAAPQTHDKGHVLVELAAAPDGSRLAVANYGGQVLLVDPENVDRRVPLEPALATWPWELAWAPDGSALAAVDQDGLLSVWQLASATQEASFWKGSEGAVPPMHDALRGKHAFGCQMRWSPSGDRLVVGDDEGRLSLWSAQGELLLRWETHHAGRDLLAAWSPDGEWLVTAEQQFVVFRAAESGQPTRGPWGEARLNTGTPISGLDVSPDGSQIATGHADHWLRVWDGQTGAKVHEERREQLFPSPEHQISVVRFAPNGQHLAYSSRRGSHVYVVHTPTWRLVRDSDYLGAHFFELMHLAWSPDGQDLWFAFECGGGDLRRIHVPERTMAVVREGAFVPSFGPHRGHYLFRGTIETAAQGAAPNREQGPKEPR